MSAEDKIKTRTIGPDGPDRVFLEEAENVASDALATIVAATRGDDHRVINVVSILATMAVAKIAASQVVVDNANKGADLQGILEALSNVDNTIKMGDQITEAIAEAIRHDIRGVLSKRAAFLTAMSLLAAKADADAEAAKASAEITTAAPTAEPVEPRKTETVH